MSTWDVLFLVGVVAAFGGFSGMLAYGSWVAGAAPRPFPGAARSQAQPLPPAATPLEPAQAPQAA